MKTIFTALLIVLAFSANSQFTWKKINHYKNYYSIELPSFFEDLGNTASGVHNLVCDIEGVSISIQSLGNGNSSTLNQAYNEDITTNKGVTYTVYKPSWYVVSGLYRKEYYYYKTLIKNGNIYYLRISYPKSQKVMFDMILGRIVQSFK